MSLASITEAVVASRDPAAAAAFMTAVFGWEALEDGSIGVRGASSGRVRLVRAEADDLPPPAVWERGPRLLSVYSRDLALTKAAAERAGGTAGPIVRYELPKPMEECVLRGPDGLFWSIPNTTPRRPSVLDSDPARLHSELHSAVINVGDIEASLRFFAGAGGMKVFFDGVLGGERMAELLGIPPEVSLRLAFLSGPDEAPARLELIQYTGIGGGELRPRRLGLRRLVFTVEKPEREAAVLIAAGGRALARDVVMGPEGIEIELR